MLKIFLLLALFSPIFMTMVSITTFSTVLYIPGTYYSLANLTYDIRGLNQYYNIGLTYQLTQVLGC